MDEGIETTAELFEKLGFVLLVWEVNEDAAFLGSRRESEQLDWDLLLDDLGVVTIANDFSDLLEEWMLEVWIVTALCSIAQKLWHGDNRDAQVNSKPVTKKSRALDLWTISISTESKR